MDIQEDTVNRQLIFRVWHSEDRLGLRSKFRNLQIAIISLHSPPFKHSMSASSVTAYAST